MHGTFVHHMVERSFDIKSDVRVESNIIKITQGTKLLFRNLRNLFLLPSYHLTKRIIMYRMYHIVIVVKMNFIWFFSFCMSVCQAVFHFDGVK